MVNSLETKARRFDNNAEHIQANTEYSNGVKTRSAEALQGEYHWNESTCLDLELLVAELKGQLNASNMATAQLAEELDHTREYGAVEAQELSQSIQRREVLDDEMHEAADAVEFLTNE